MFQNFILIVIYWGCQPFLVYC